MAFMMAKWYNPISIFKNLEDVMFKRKNEQPVGLKIIVVGCGKVGSTLVEQLVMT